MLRSYSIAAAFALLSLVCDVVPSFIVRGKDEAGKPFLLATLTRFLCEMYDCF